jgi:hypothetical protein
VQSYFSFVIYSIQMPEYSMLRSRTIVRWHTRLVCFVLSCFAALSPSLVLAENDKQVWAEKAKQTFAK